MAPYADVSVIVEGALEEEATFHDETLMRDWIAHVIEDLRADGVSGQVYVVHHDHDESDEDCACVQYLTDHRPFATTDEEG